MKGEGGKGETSSSQLASYLLSLRHGRKGEKKEKKKGKRASRRGREKKRVERLTKVGLYRQLPPTRSRRGKGEEGEGERTERETFALRLSGANGSEPRRKTRRESFRKKRKGERHTSFGVPFSNDLSEIQEKRGEGEKRERGGNPKKRRIPLGLPSLGPARRSTKKGEKKGKGEKRGEDMAEGKIKNTVSIALFFPGCVRPNGWKEGGDKEEERGPRKERMT